MRTLEVQTKIIHKIPNISDIPVNSSFLTSSDFFQESYGSHRYTSPVCLKQETIDSTVQGLENDEIKACSMVSAIMPNMEWTCSEY